MSGQHRPAEPRSGTSGRPGTCGRPGAPDRPGAGAPPRDGVTDLVRWAAFGCALVPVALLWYGAPFAGTVGTALGLAAVTGACRLLMRRSERVAARSRGGSRHRAEPPVRGAGRHAGENTPVD